MLPTGGFAALTPRLSNDHPLTRMHREVLSPYDGGLRDPLWWPQERPVPMRVAIGPLGIPLPSMPGPKTLCGIGAGT